MTSQDDRDYAQGYYDGIQLALRMGTSIPYLRGFEDGWADNRELKPWSDEKQIAVMEAYTVWVEFRDADKPLQ